MADPKGTTPAPKATEAKPVETKRARTVRILNKRANVLLNAARLVGNCSGPGYETTPEDVAVLFAAIREGVDAAEARFNASAKANREPVTLIS